MNGVNMQVFVGGSEIPPCAIWSSLPMGLIRSRSRESLTSHPRTRSFFAAPDADATEEAIINFVDGLEQQQRRGFSLSEKFTPTFNAYLFLDLPKSAK